MASAIRKACWGRNTTWKSVCPTARPAIPGERAEVAARRDAGVPGHDRCHGRQQGRHRDRRQDEYGPRYCGLPGAAAIPPAAPRRLAGAESVRRRLSSIFHVAQQGQRAIAAGRRSAALTPAYQPREQLPVPPRPAVLARARHVVAGREFLDDLDIGHERGPGKDAFEQIVAEESALGGPPGHGRLERVDVVDALAGVGPLAEQVLVHVGHGRGVRIQAWENSRRCAGRSSLPGPWAGKG